jgi:DNA-binding CsgD family transcriptional regulator
MPRRYCLPCEVAARRAGTLPRLALTPSVRQLEILQALADGLSDEEIAERDSVTVDGVRQSVMRARRKLRVTPTLSAAVAVCLAHELIKPDTSGPQPPRSAETAPYAASVLALVQGRRRPMSPKDVQRLRLLDALYAWSEPHAVSVLWAAGTITARDVAPLFAKRKR